MSATSPQSQSISTAAAKAPAATAGEIDASCRALVLVFISAALWLLAGSLIGLLASLKFHAPAMLSECPAMTYGRLYPAATNSFLYGFAVPAGLAAVTWIICQGGKTKLLGLPFVITGWLFWNIGLALGILGLFYGDTTGYDWMELPRYGIGFIFAGYLMFALAAMITFHQRTERGLTISLWFILAAIFWFPWIYSTAVELLVFTPVRGTMLSVVDGWYVNNLANVWFALIGLSMTYYFVQKVTNRPLHSRALGTFTFWCLVTFASWGYVPYATPVPSWLPAFSMFASVMTLIPTLAVAVNVKNSLSGVTVSDLDMSWFKFVRFGVIAYVIAMVLRSIASLAEVSVVTDFTWFTTARMQLYLYGFYALTVLGAMYHIIPRLAGKSFPSSGFVRGHYVLAVLGVILYFVPLALGGIKQGMAMRDGSIPFEQVMNGTKMFLRISTTGELLVILGNLLLVLNLVRLFVPICWSRLNSWKVKYVETVEVAS